MEQLYNLGVRERFMRQTNLPTNWLKVRLGIIASLTGAPGDNSAPVADSISNTLAPILHSSMLFGLADGTAGFPGDAGSGKFVGVKNYVAAGATLYVYYYPTASQWHIDVSGSGSGTSPGMIPLFTNGATLGQGTNVATGNVCTFGDPTAASGNVCFAWIIELDVSTANQLRIGHQFVVGLNRTDDPQMSAAMMAVPIYRFSRFSCG